MIRMGFSTKDRGQKGRPLSNKIQQNLYIQEEQSTAQVLISNATSGILNWESSFTPDQNLAGFIEKNPNILTLSINKGRVLTGNDTINIIVDRKGLPPGKYSGKIEIKTPATLLYCKRHYCSIRPDW